MDCLNVREFESTEQDPLQQGEAGKWKAIGGRFVLAFDDAHLDPVVFSGEGAEDAAIGAYYNNVNCHLYAEVALNRPACEVASGVSESAAFVTVHHHKQVHIEVLDSQQQVSDRRSFNRMAEARAFLSAQGFKEDQVTIKVERRCGRATPNPGYVGIFHCADCEQSCVD